MKNMYSNVILQKGRCCKVAIIRTETRGWGLFALENIPANAFVVEYIGEVSIRF